MSQAKPKPCPFCGGTRFRINEASEGRHTRSPASVWCLDCWAVGPHKHAESKREAVEAWNARGVSDDA